MKSLPSLVPWLPALLFVVLLAWTAGQKFSQPLTPVYDPDTPGYLVPALLQLSGEGLQQTQGRSFFYPALVLGLLRLTGDLKSIVIAQHVVSLLTAVVWMATWVVWCSFLPRSWTRLLLAPLLGLAALGFYLAGAETVLFGLQIRPEAVFPLAASLQILCLMVFIKTRWPSAGEPDFFLVVASGAGAVVFTVAAYSLKQSWGFATLLSPLVLGLGILVHRRGQSFPAAAAPLVLGGLLALLFLAGVPAALHWKSDTTSKFFLPMNLFAVHADIISDGLRADVAAGRATPEEADFSNRLSTGLEESRKNPGSYALLSHNPDYLMYASDTLNRIPNVFSPEDKRAFFFRAFLRSMAHDPVAYLRKWQVQMRAAVFQDPKFLCRQSGNLKKLYAIASNCPITPPPALPGNLAANCRQVAVEQGSLAKTLPPSQFMGPKFLKKAGQTGAFLYPWCLLAGLFLLAACPFFYPDHLLPVLTAWLVSAASLLSAMTVAFVHSFDIDRYLALQSWLAWLTIACWLAVLLSLGESRVRRLFHPTDGEKSPDAPESSP